MLDILVFVLGCVFSFLIGFYIGHYIGNKLADYFYGKCQCDRCHLIQERFKNVKSFSASR